MYTNHSSEPMVDSVEAGAITLIRIQTAMLTDVRTITAVADEIRAISRRVEPPNILLNFRQVQHVSLDFLDAMRDVAEEIEVRGGTVFCSSLRKEARAVLRTLGVDVAYVGNNPRYALARCLAILEMKNAPWPVGPARAR